MRLAAGVEYQGAGFSGWQRQAGQRTVQECIESAISKVANHPITVHCVGRTDAGFLNQLRWQHGFGIAGNPAGFYFCIGQRQD